MEIGRLFWEQLDPLYHLRQATCFRYTKDLTEHYRLGEREMAETPLGAELQSGFEDMQQSAMRFTRFHATETFLTVLLGSGPHGPVPRFSSRVRLEAFNTAVAQLGERKIPEILPISGITDFESWLSTMFWGTRNLDVNRTGFAGGSNS